jgi:hypothetical protein
VHAVDNCDARQSDEHAGNDDTGNIVRLQKKRTNAPYDSEASPRSVRGNYYARDEEFTPEVTP